MASHAPVFRNMNDIRNHLQQLFPGLRNSRWVINSPLDRSYQCIAWAACRVNIKWWPPGYPPDTYWPLAGLDDDSVDAFVAAFEMFGYTRCNDRTFKIGYQKVAIYAYADRTATHMARQHLLGKGWLSKLGDFEDIIHPNLSDIEGSTDPNLYEYGEVAQIMQRSIWTALRKGCLFRSSVAAWRFRRYRTKYPHWCGRKI
jgi:hypothetical protein